jgi:hypothetical protein
MTQALFDNTGAPVTVRLSETRPIGSYSINLASVTERTPRHTCGEAPIGSRREWKVWLRPCRG